MLLLLLLLWTCGYEPPWNFFVWFFRSLYNLSLSLPLSFSLFLRPVSKILEETHAMVAQAKKDKSHQLWSISPSSPSCIFVKPMDLDLRVAVIIQREALPKKRPTLLRRLPFELSKKKESLEQPPILKKLSDLKWKCDDERFLKTALFECLSLSL